MSFCLILSFRKDVSIMEIPGGNIVLQAVGIGLKLDILSRGAIAAFAVLLSEGMTRDGLSDIVLEKDGFSGLPKFNYYLENFIHLGLICHTVSVNNFPLVKIVPYSPVCKLQLSNLALNTQYSLSRFAYAHKDWGEMILESPLSHAQITLGDWRGMAIITELVKPRSIQELASIIPGLSEELLQVFLSFLLSAEMIYEFPDTAHIGEENSETLGQWEFHDLLFHFRSRRGRHLNPVGKTYRFLNQIEPLPVITEVESQERINLYKPDIEKLKETDYPFSLVLEERKSIRNYGEKLLSAEQIGEFLYRCARVRGVFSKDYREVSNRPYPSGGACYELEIYPVITACDGILAGFYHYCPQNHQLSKVSEINTHVNQLLEEAKWTATLQTQPPVLIVVTARFARVSGIYESVAYSLILKHVGVLYQTMYLVATAMNLAPCALGTGNSDLFARAMGINSYGELSVGEFILGNK